MDVLLDNHADGGSVNAQAADVAERLAEAHQAAREQLQAAAAYSKAWYDRKAKQQVFSEGESVRVLDQRGYAKRTPKWQLPYRVVGTVVKKLNDVTYVVSAKEWRQNRVLHVDKLRKMEAGADGAVPDRPAAVL